MGLNLFFFLKKKKMATSEKQGIPAVKKKGAPSVCEVKPAVVLAVGGVVEDQLTL